MEFLHWQSHASRFSAILNSTGVNFVPLWVPSQNGCFELFPHEHQANDPGSRVTSTGIFGARFGFSIIVDFSLLVLLLTYFMQEPLGTQCYTEDTQSYTVKRKKIQSYTVIRYTVLHSFFTPCDTV